MVGLTLPGAYSAGFDVDDRTYFLCYERITLAAVEWSIETGDGNGARGEGSLQ